jgi:shikimate dehydrogenase
MAGLEGTSRRVELGAKDKTKLNKVMRKEFDALSITMPLKGFGVEICDELDDVATRTGSVNSLLMRDGTLLGASTDGDGFVNAVRGQFDERRRGARRGARRRGAASAIIDGLVRHGVASVAVHGRNEAKVEALVARYANVYDFSLTYRPVDLIVNTTPVAGRAEEAAVMQGVGAAHDRRRHHLRTAMSAWRACTKRSGCPARTDSACWPIRRRCRCSGGGRRPIDGARLLR